MTQITTSGERNLRQPIARGPQTPRQGLQEQTSAPGLAVAPPSQAGNNALSQFFRAMNALDRLAVRAGSAIRQEQGRKSKIAQAEDALVRGQATLGARTVAPEIEAAILSGSQGIKLPNESALERAGRIIPGFFPDAEDDEVANRARLETLAPMIARADQARLGIIRETERDEIFSAAQGLPTSEAVKTLKAVGFNEEDIDGFLVERLRAFAELALKEPENALRGFGVVAAQLGSREQEVQATQGNELLSNAKRGFADEIASRRLDLGESDSEETPESVREFINSFEPLLGGVFVDQQLGKLDSDLKAANSRIATQRRGNMRAAIISDATDFARVGRLAEFTAEMRTITVDGVKVTVSNTDLERAVAFELFREIAENEPVPQLRLEKQLSALVSNGIQLQEHKEKMTNGVFAIGETLRQRDDAGAIPKMPDSALEGFDLFKKFKSVNAPYLSSLIGSDTLTRNTYEVALILERRMFPEDPSSALALAVMPREIKRPSQARPSGLPSEVFYGNKFKTAFGKKPEWFTNGRAIEEQVNVLANILTNTFGIPTGSATEDAMDAIGPSYFRVGKFLVPNDSINMPPNAELVLNEAVLDYVSKHGEEEGITNDDISFLPPRDANGLWIPVDQNGFPLEHFREFSFNTAEIGQRGKLIDETKRDSIIEEQTRRFSVGVKDDLTSRLDADDFEAFDNPDIVFSNVAIQQMADARETLIRRRDTSMFRDIDIEAANIEIARLTDLIQRNQLKLQGQPDTP